MCYSALGDQSFKEDELSHYQAMVLTVFIKQRLRQH